MSPHTAPKKTHTDHRARVFKDEYSHPVWQVYYGPYWVGSAHSLTVAHQAANTAIHAASQRCESSVHQLYLIHAVTIGLPHTEFWEPAKVYYDHKTWRDHLLNPLEPAV